MSVVGRRDRRRPHTGYPVRGRRCRPGAEWIRPVPSDRYGSGQNGSDRYGSGRNGQALSVARRGAVRLAGAALTGLALAVVVAGFAAAVAAGLWLAA